MKYLLVSVIAGCLLLVSCHDEETVDKPVVFDRDMFNAKRAAWQTKGMADYAFAQQVYRNPPADWVEFTVKGGKCINNNDTQTGVYIADTIDGIFSYVETEFEKDVKRVKDKDGDLAGLIVKITYDDEYCYPKEIDYSPSTGKTEAPGGKNGFRVEIKLSLGVRG
jgi:hypothetical protein